MHTLSPTELENVLRVMNELDYRHYQELRKRMRTGATMDFDLYKNNLPYPSKQYQYAVYSKGTVLGIVDTRGEFDALKFANPKSISEHYQIDEDVYREEMAVYHREDGRLRELFKKDLFDYFGINLNPKREALYEKASEDNEGVQDIYYKFGDLVDLIR